VLKLLLFNLFYFSTYNSLLSDGFWHSICLTWSNVDGILTVYKDNVLTDQASGVATGKNISGGGRWVLGQDQDSVGGGFAIKDAFEGELAEVNVWGRVITKQEIACFSTDCQRRMNGDVKSWTEFRTGLRREVRAVDEPSCTKCKFGVS
jgi:CUB/sushi domain-containing protein